MSDLTQHCWDGRSIYSPVWISFMYLLLLQWCFQFGSSIEWYVGNCSSIFLFLFFSFGSWIVEFYLTFFICRFKLSDLFIMCDEKEGHGMTSLPSSSPICENCGNPSRYRCPSCAIRSCSVACVKAHKKQFNCNGYPSRSRPVSSRQELTEDILFQGSCLYLINYPVSNYVKSITVNVNNACLLCE